MSESLLDQCMSLDWQGLCRLYAQLLRESPKNIDLPARALRNKARAGELPESAIPTLIACLLGTQDALVIADLAKTFAALGRRASVASVILVEKLKGMIISDDPEFWAFDGTLNALGYVGGEGVDALLEEFAQRSPVSRTGDLYQGVLPEEEREAIFADTLERVKALLAQEEPGAWLKKRTDWTPESREPQKKLPAWLASVS